MTADLIEFAAVQQRSFDTLTSADERKKRGHFGTPPVIAESMAAMFGVFEKSRRKPVRVLDAGAGVGTLSAAICQRILQQKTFRTMGKRPKTHSAARTDDGELSKVA